MIFKIVDGTGEIVQDGVNGCLIPPCKSELIAEKIIFLIENPCVKTKYEQNAWKRHGEVFSFDRFARSYINFYEKL